MKANLPKWKSISEIGESVLLLCLVIPLIKPDGVSNINAVLPIVIWDYCQHAVGIFSVFLFLIRFMQKKSISFAGSVFLSFACLGLVLTVLRGGSLQTWYLNYSNTVYMCFLFEIFQERLPKLINAVLLYLNILLSINLVCMILYPEGMYYSRNINYSLNWFLGYKSSLQYYVIPAITLGWIDEHYCGHKKRFLVSMMICLIETLISQNVMLLVAVVFIICVYFFNINKNTKVFNGITYISGGILVNLLVVFYSAVFINSHLGSSLLALLGKDGTISGRLNIIWPRALLYIKDRKWFGYGVMSSEAHVNILGMPAAIHAHNQILEILLCGGLFLLFLFLLFLSVAAFRMWKSKELITSQILGISAFSILAMVSVEVFTRGCGSATWLLFLLGCVPQKIDKEYQVDYSKKKKRYRKIKFVIHKEKAL